MIEMVKIVVSRDKTGSIRSLKIDGHSGYDRAGKDIICAAVSVTAYTAAGSLEDLAGLKGCYDERDGHMTIRLPGRMSEQQESTAGIILEAAVIGFKQIELSYGKYVLVVEEEVGSDD